MAAGPAVRRGRLHAALQAVLAARVTYDRHAYAVLSEATEQVKPIAEALDTCQMRSAVRDIETEVGRFRTTVLPILNDGAAALDRHAHAFLQTLAQLHGHRPAPAFSPGPHNHVGNAGNGTRFEGNFAAAYAATVLTDISHRVTMSYAEVAAIPPMTRQRIEDTAEEIVQLMPDRCRKRARDLLFAKHSHAVAFHGPHLTTEELIARCAWARPLDHGATRRKKWEIRPDDTVHELSYGEPAAPTSGQFTSPEAFAKALTAFFDTADRYVNAEDNQGGMAKMLSDNAVAGRAVIDTITMADAGLGRGDAVTYKTAGARGAHARDDWVLARSRAMASPATRHPSVPVRKVEPMLVESDPKLTFVFQETAATGKDHWLLITMYA